LAAEKVFQSDRYVPRADRIRSAGPSGCLHVQEGRTGFLWTSYATGATVELGKLPSLEVPGYLGSSSDVVAEVVSPTEKVVLKDMAAGTSTEVTLSHGTYQATFGTHVLTQARDADGNRTPWLYGSGAPADGTPVEGWPTGITADFTVLGGDSTTAVLDYAQPNGVQHLVVVDLASAKVTGDVVLNAVPTGVALSADRLVWWSGLWSPMSWIAPTSRPPQRRCGCPARRAPRPWASPGTGWWWLVPCRRTRRTGSTSPASGCVTRSRPGSRRRARRRDRKRPCLVR
jgi:hypothetical protein